MFTNENLHKLSQADGFTFWLYAASGRADAEAARNQLGYFTSTEIRPGDALFVTGAGVTSLHWAIVNQHENEIALQLFGG